MTNSQIQSLPRTPHGASERLEEPAKTFEELVDELISNPDNSLKIITEILQQDLALRSQVIKEANAFIYSLGKPVANLSQAIACLGYSRCRAIITAGLLAEQITPAKPPQHQTSIESSSPKEGGESLLRGSRPFRKERLSSLYPPKNRAKGPHFSSSLFPQS